MKEEELRCILKLEKENNELVKKVKVGIKRLLNQNDQKDKEIKRLNNIIDELEKEFEWQLKNQIDIDKFAEEQGFLNYNPVRLMVEHFKNKLKELKEGK